MTFSDLILGKRLATDEAPEQRVGWVEGVGVLGLDALSSAAYGPEALLTVLLPLGVAGLARATPLTLVIAALLVILFVSYRQTIHAYPAGGGSYTVTKENLGRGPSLVAAAALLLDYLLNVSVGIAAGVGAVTSAIPALLPHTVPLCLLVLATLTFVNLRGVRATGAVFLVPTYLFVGALALVLAAGAYASVRSGGHPHAVVEPRRVLDAGGAHVATAWLLLRSFANGCTAMTGVEAVSNGVPIFREPPAVNARRALAAIIGTLVVLLVGVVTLCRAYGITATSPGAPGYESVLSQLYGAVVGRGALYDVAIAATFLVLAFSANTSFADFPRVCLFLARDGFLPETFAHRGRRLVYSHGIVVLAVISAALLLVFHGVTDRLIPLFAFGAFVTFTASQAGMVAHWRKQRGAPGARRSLVLNAVGAVATGITACVVLASKFVEGAWISAVILALMLLLFTRVRAHYDRVARAVALRGPLELSVAASRAVAVVPMRRLDAVSLKALSFAIEIAREVIAVQVLTGDQGADDLPSRWGSLVEAPARAARRAAPRLVVFRSEYRELLKPLVEFVCELAEEHGEDTVAVVVPELVEPRWYHYLLHATTAPMLKALLLWRGDPRVVVVSVPYHLDAAGAPAAREVLGPRERNDHEQARES